MKILFYRYGSICEPDIIETFKIFGFETIEFRHEMTNKDLSPAEGVGIVSRFLNDHPVDAIFSINFFPFVSEVCNIYHIPYLSWIVDSPVMELYATSIQNPYNRVFLFDREMYNEIHPLNPSCVFHLPLAVNVRDKQKAINEVSLKDREKFTCDISFVGSLYTEKCPYDRFKTKDDVLKGFLDGLMAAQMKVYGYYFVEECLKDDVVSKFKKEFKGFYEYPAETFLTDKITLSQLYIGNKISAMERLEVMRRLSERYNVELFTGSDTKDLPKVHNRGLAKSLTEMPVIFANSVINLNITSKAIRSGMPQRVFDILGCGGFMLSNYQTELLEYFNVGEDIDIYESMDDLVYKCGYYLAHPDIAAQMAKNAFEKVCKYHTLEVRMADMFELAFKRG
ncbi:MAG: DUF3880 domain-containing protein [Eubacterium sp.]|nr:DUF3880 domain-containing protein [Eubacterium sp.]